MHRHCVCTYGPLVRVIIISLCILTSLLLCVYHVSHPLPRIVNDVRVITMSLYITTISSLSVTT